MADSEQLMELEILFDSENAAFINSEDLYSQLNGIWEIWARKKLNFYIVTWIS